MQLVYATGQHERDFRIADSREDVPSGARVYATCTQETTVESVGEVTFQTMSDEEFMSLKAQVREARERAMAERPAGGGDNTARTVRKFIGKLLSR